MPARSRLWPDPRVKPPYGSVEIDFGHPLGRGLTGCWLFNEEGGFPGNLARGRERLDVFTGVPAWEASSRGLVQAVYRPGNIYVNFKSTTLPVDVAGGPVSCFSWLYMTTVVAGQFMARDTGNNGWRYRCDGGGGTISILDRGGTNILTSSGALVANVWQSIGVRMDASGLAIF